MFPSIEIVNTTQQTLEFQKGSRLIRLTPGPNTLGEHEWPFAQRMFGDKVRLAKNVPTKTYIDGPNAPERVPEPEPINLDAAERRDHDAHFGALDDALAQVPSNAFAATPDTVTEPPSELFTEAAEAAPEVQTDATGEPTSVEIPASAAEVNSEPEAVPEPEPVAPAPAPEPEPEPVVAPEPEPPVEHVPDAARKTKTPAAHKSHGKQGTHKT